MLAAGYTTPGDTTAPGHWTLGNLHLRAPVRSEQVATVNLPSFRSGCRGIDAIAGAFSFINSDQLVAFAGAAEQQLHRCRYWIPAQLAAVAPPHAFLSTQTTLPTMCTSCAGTAYGA